MQGQNGRLDRKRYIHLFIGFHERIAKIIFPARLPVVVPGAETGGRDINHIDYNVVAIENDHSALVESPVSFVENAINAGKV